MKKYLEAGKIVNTHALAGAVKVMPWADSPEFLQKFRRVFIEGREYRVLSSSVQKNAVLMKFEGITTVEDAMRLRDRVVMIDRDDAGLPEGRYFVEDLVGLRVFDLRAQREIGTLSEILNLPAGEVYVVRNGEEEYMIPGNPVFLKEIDIKAGLITVETIRGMLNDT